MHKLKRVYLILTYMFFIYPPFIAGLVLIYNEQGDFVERTSLFVNLIVLIVLTGIVSLAIYYKKLHVPTKEEIKYLIFGLTGNIVMYFYTFQNNLHIENIVTIYLVLLIVLGVYFLLISKKLQPLELWILLPIFLIYDYVFLGLTGCGYSSDWGCAQSTTYFPVLIPIFFIIIAFIMLYYIYKIVLYRLFDFFKITNIILAFILSFIAFGNFEANEKFTLTVVILLPFFIIVDFIVSIVNKTIKKQMFLFYIRTTTLIVISIIIGASGVLQDYRFEASLLSIFVVTTYVSLFISILKTVLRIEEKDANVLNLFKQKSTVVKYIPCTVEHLSNIENSFSSYRGTITFHDNDYNLQAVIGNEIIGLLYSSMEELKIKQKTLQAKVYYFEIKDDFKKHANELLYHLERHYKSKGVSHIKYMAQEHEENLIDLLLHRGYTPIDAAEGFIYLIKTI